MLRVARRLTVVAVAALAVVAGAGAAGTGQARVAVVQRVPLEVAGSGFGRGVRLQVVARTVPAVSRAVRSGATGAFLVRFPSVQLSRCDALSVVVRGPQGMVVRGFAKAMPECAERATG